MANVSRENLKARFKRGMYPTEGDFANLMDSYVHKDDGIDINDVTAENGSKTLTTLLQEFKQEILQDAKDQETQYDDTELAGRVSTNEGNISSLEGRVSTNEGDISGLKDDLDTAEDYIAGHESRIQALEERTEVPEGLEDFIEKVNSFLEDADASDATINKWKEIEAFLSGITDTETLAGLLADLKEEILGEIPEQKEYTAGDGIDISEDGVISLKPEENKLDCLKVIADLDASDAPKGTIAIYSGATNEKYTHGFVYEKGEGGKTAFTLTINNNGAPFYYTGESEVQGINTASTGRAERTVYKVKYYEDKVYNRDLYYWVSVSPEQAKGISGTVYGFLWAPDGHGTYAMWDSGYVTAYEGGEGGWQALNVMNVIG